MRILIDYRPALRERTGVGEYAHELARALVGLLSPADRLLLFSSSWKDRLARDVLPGADAVDSRVPVRLLNFLWHRLEWPPIERFAAGVDIAHSLHPLLMPAARAARVVTVHDLHFLDTPAHAAGEVRRDYSSLIRAHVRRADGVIVNSEATAARVRAELAVSSDAIAVCPPGAPSWTRAEPYAHSGPILFMGTIEPRKNVPALLDAYEKLIERERHAPQLLLAGKVAPSCRAVVEKISAAPLAGHVRHLGYVSDAERERLYRQASMLVLPSLDEGFGMPVLEAMTVGIPVVASRRGAIPEVAGDAALLVEPEDVAGMAAAMARLLEDEALARRCIAAGLVRAQRFRWKSSAATLLEAYSAAIERRRLRT